MYATFFAQWIYVPGFPCQKSVLIFMSSVSSAMQWKATVKSIVFFICLFVFSSFTFSTRTLGRELCFSQLWNTVPWQAPFCGSVILRLVPTQMPELSWAGSCSPFSIWVFLKWISVLILSPFLWEWCFLWGCLGQTAFTWAGDLTVPSTGHPQTLWRQWERQVCWKCRSSALETYAILYWYITFSATGVAGSKKA